MNRNLGNYFAKVEQAAFNPGSLRARHRSLPRRMLEGRLFFYGDTYSYQLGAPHIHPAVNQPHVSRASNYDCDTSMRTNINQAGERNYGDAPVHPSR